LVFWDLNAAGYLHLLVAKQSGLRGDDKMPDAAPPRRKQRWYVDIDSKTYGPYDEPAIDQMVEGGQILSNDLVIREGASEWIEGANDPVLGALFRKRPKRSVSALADPPVRQLQRRWSG